MKPFLGIDVTQNKKNEQPNGIEFCVAVPAQALSQALERSMEKATVTEEKAKLPLALRIVQYVCGIAGFLAAAGILKADVSLTEGYQNAPWLFWGTGVCLAIWSILWLWAKQRSKTILSSEESTQTLSNLEGVANAIYGELEVPADAPEVDVLTFFYKEKNGQIKVQEKGVVQYFNPVYRIFADSENLYIVNCDGKNAFPLASLKGIRTVKKRARIMSWNKDVAYNEGAYAPFKLTVDQYGCIHCKCYHILELEHGGTAWGIYFPSYELPVLERITGLKAE